MLLPVLDAVALSIDAGEREECWKEMDDETSGEYFLEICSDDWTVVVEVSSDEWTTDVEISSDDWSNVVDVISNPLLLVIISVEVSVGVPWENIWFPA